MPLLSESLGTEIYIYWDDHCQKFCIEVLIDIDRFNQFPTLFSVCFFENHFNRFEPLFLFVCLFNQATTFVYNSKPFPLIINRYKIAK